MPQPLSGCAAVCVETRAWGKREENVCTVAFTPCAKCFLVVGSAMVALKWASGEQGGEGHLPVTLGEPNTVRAVRWGLSRKEETLLVKVLRVARHRDEGWKADVGGDVEFRQGTRWRRRRDDTKKAIKRARERETGLTGTGQGENSV